MIAKTMIKNNTVLKYIIITFGCQMNKSDSERAASLIESIGMVKTTDYRAADFILLNTCSVRERGEKRVYGLTFNYAKLKKTKPHLIIGVMGCMAGRDTDGKIRKRLKAVDIFFATADMTTLPKFLASHFPELVNNSANINDYLLIKPKYQSRTEAFIPIMTGCNNFCTYCVVPFARGREKCRSVSTILTEIHQLAANGCLQITLLGQNVNSFHAQPSDFNPDNPFHDNFAQLLWEINQIKGIMRLHFTAPHPHDMSDEVIDAMTLSTHLNFIHLPVQSGSDRILTKMQRDYSAAEFITLVNRIRKKIPQIAIATDIIVGFCSETEADFQQTVALYKVCDFDISYTAIYSQRSGTRAAKWADDVPYLEKKRRWRILQDLMLEITLRKNQAFIGQTLAVLVQSYRLGTCTGWSSEQKMIEFNGKKDLIGKIVQIKIESAFQWVLTGVLV